MRYSFLAITDDYKAIEILVEEMEGGGWKDGNQILSEMYDQLIMQNETLGSIKAILVKLEPSN